MKNSPKPLAPHVQKCLNRPAAQVQAMMVRGHVPAPHVQAAVQRCQVPVLQARRVGVVPPAPVQAPAQPSLHTRAIQRARPAVIQRSNSEEGSFEFSVVKGESSQKPSGMSVKMDNKGTVGYALAGLYTLEVRNCVVLCMFSSPSLKPLQKIYMHHSPWYELLPEEALKVVKEWGSGATCYIIGGNDEKFFEENTFSGSWAGLNIVGVKSPLTRVGTFANIEIKGNKITYWIHDDEESTAVNLLGEI